MSEQMENIDLTSAQRRTVVGLLKQYLPAAEVWAYGSRVTFTAQPMSDLDLVVFVDKKQARAVAGLREAFVESRLPFSVDVLVWDSIPERFKANIQQAYFILCEKEKRKKTI